MAVDEPGELLPVAGREPKLLCAHLEMRGKQESNGARVGQRIDGTFGTRFLDQLLELIQSSRNLPTGRVPPYPPCGEGHQESESDQQALAGHEERVCHKGLAGRPRDGGPGTPRVS